MTIIPVFLTEDHGLTGKLPRSLAQLVRKQPSLVATDPHFTQKVLHRLRAPAEGMTTPDCEEDCLGNTAPLLA